MNEEHRQKIEEIMGEMSCTINFECVESGFEILGKARSRRMKSYVDCLEDEPRLCTFDIPFGKGRLCKCRLRVYLCNELGL